MTFAGLIAFLGYLPQLLSLWQKIGEARFQAMLAGAIADQESADTTEKKDAAAEEVAKSIDGA